MFRRKAWHLCSSVMVAGLVAVGGCSPKIQVSMERVGSRYVLGFKMDGKDSRVESLFVSTLQGGQAKDTVCQWDARDPLNPVVGRWIYGDQLPPEYVKHGCAPLAPGLYRIQAIGGGGGGILDVRIDATGNVQRL